VIMAFYVNSGNPEDERASAMCITSCVHKNELPDEDLELFLVEKFAQILRRTKRLHRVEMDINTNYIFTLYTYAEPLEVKKATTREDG